MSWSDYCRRCGFWIEIDRKLCPCKQISLLTIHTSSMIACIPEPFFLSKVSVTLCKQGLAIWVHLTIRAWMSMVQYNDGKKLSHNVGTSAKITSYVPEENLSLVKTHVRICCSCFVSVLFTLGVSDGMPSFINVTVNVSGVVFRPDFPPRDSRRQSDRSRSARSWLGSSIMHLSRSPTASWQRFRLLKQHKMTWCNFENVKTGL